MEMEKLKAKEAFGLTLVSIVIILAFLLSPSCAKMERRFTDVKINRCKWLFEECLNDGNSQSKCHSNLLQYNCSTKEVVGE